MYEPLQIFEDGEICTFFSTLVISAIEVGETGLI